MKPVYEKRKYIRPEVVVFRKTKEEYGGLSNMASGFPIKLFEINILSSEALYQACRYPHRPDIQFEIIKQKSPMTAKMISKKYLNETRRDWDLVRIQVMRWCLRIKLLQNWEKFSKLLMSTGNKDIVEESKKDSFWGAIPYDEKLLIGVNALGRLLMELREEMKLYNSNMCVLNPPNIKEFCIFGKEVKKMTIHTISVKDEYTSKVSQLDIFEVGK